MSVKEVMSVEEFNQLFQSGKKYVFVDFYAQWCGPCKKIAPEIEKLSEQYKNVCFCKIDVDEVPELVNHYKITTLPTFIMFEVTTRQQKHDRIVGSDIESIRKLLNVFDFNVDNLSSSNF